MKLAVFGATGKTGMEIVKQALEEGHSVVAFVRDPGKMTLQNPQLTVVQGDAMDAASVEKGIEGVDAVLVALGAGPDGKAVNTVGTQNIIAAMKQLGVKRLVVEGSYPMNGSPESMAFLGTMMPADQIKNVQGFIDDKAGQAKATVESELDWTLVHPLSLTEESKTGQYRVGETLEVKPGDHISRADVADFMLKVLTTSEWVGKVVIVSN